MWNVLGHGKNENFPVSSTPPAAIHWEAPLDPFAAIQEAVGCVCVCLHVYVRACVRGHACVFVRFLHVHAFACASWCSFAPDFGSFPHLWRDIHSVAQRTLLLLLVCLTESIAKGTPAFLSLTLSFSHSLYLDNNRTKALASTRKEFVMNISHSPLGPSLSSGGEVDTVKRGIGRCSECGFILSRRRLYGGCQLFYPRCPLCRLGKDSSGPVSNDNVDNNHTTSPRGFYAESVVRRCGKELIAAYELTSAQTGGVSTGLLVLQKEIQRLFLDDNVKQGSTGHGNDPSFRAKKQMDENQSNSSPRAPTGSNHAKTPPSSSSSFSPKSPSSLSQATTAVNESFCENESPLSSSFLLGSDSTSFFLTPTSPSYSTLGTAATRTTTTTNNDNDNDNNDTVMSVDLPYFRMLLEAVFPEIEQKLWKREADQAPGSSAQQVVDITAELDTMLVRSSIDNVITNNSQHGMDDSQDSEGNNEAMLDPAVLAATVQDLVLQIKEVCMGHEYATVDDAQTIKTALYQFLKKRVRLLASVRGISVQDGEAMTIATTTEQHLDQIELHYKTVKQYLKAAAKGLDGSLGLSLSRHAQSMRRASTSSSSLTRTTSLLSTHDAAAASARLIVEGLRELSGTTSSTRASVLCERILEAIKTTTTTTNTTTTDNNNNNQIRQSLGLEQDDTAAATGSKGITVFMNEQGIPTVIGALWLHKNNPPLYTNGCRLLQTITRDSKSRKSKVVQHGGIDLLVHMLRQQASNVSVQQHCMDLLKRLCAYSNRTTAKAGGSGVIEAVLSGLQLHVSHVRLQVSGISLLLSLADKNATNAEIVRDCGGVPHVVAALRQHPTATQVQFCGLWFCLAVMYIAKNKDETTMDESNDHHHHHHDNNKKKVKTVSVTTMAQTAPDQYMHSSAVGYVRDSSGVSLAIQAIRTHPEEARIQHAALTMLKTLCHDHVGCKVEFEEEGGVECLLDAMKQHRGNKSVEKAVCWAVREVSLEHETTQTDIRENGGILLLLNVMKRHSTEASVQTAGCEALYGLTDRNPTNQKAIVARDGIGLVLNGLDTHRQDADLQRAGCQALLALASGNSKGKDAIRDGGGIDLLVSALKLHPSAIDFQEAGCWLLGRLADGNVQNQDLVGQSGGVQAILQSMRTLPSEAKLQKNGSWALDRLVTNDHEANGDRFLDSSGPDVIVDAIRNHGVHMPFNSSLRKLLRTC